MMKMNWKLALITFAVLPLIIYATKIFRDKVRDSYRRIRTAIARINSYLQEAVSGMLVLQLFNREKRAFSKFSDINASHMEAFKDAIMAYSVYYPVVEISSALAVASIIWWGGNDVIRGVASIGVLVAFMQYAQRFFRPIQDLSEKYNILQSAMAAGERVFKLLDTKIEVTSATVTKKPQGPGRVEFDHVWFAYNISVQASGATGVPARPDPASLVLGLSSAGTGRSPVTTQAGPPPMVAPLAHEPDWVLRDVSFALEPGETIAVVGHTGAGKTTLISLLMRFYDVQRGSIRIDGVDIKQMNLDDLRGRFGVVLQDPFLFSGTVAGNIRLGTARIQDADVEQAAEDVNLADFIRTLPGGFMEEVRERGSTLSTGQKQLISFARALAHNPKILILDEATSSVDTETEFRVRDALNRMVQGRTALIIAHRLSTIQRADKIIVMHKGQVREMGSHQQLLAQRGIYYKLYQLQYKDQEINVERAPSPANADD
jgi:ATP-binding cassette subfamily B protein